MNSLNYNLCVCLMVPTLGSLEAPGPLLLKPPLYQIKNRTQHYIYSTLTCYLCFVRTIYPKDVVVSCCLIVACCIHASAALVECCVNTWAWKPVLSQLLIPLVEVPALLAYIPPPLFVWLSCSLGLLLLLHHIWQYIFVILMTRPQSQIHFAFVSLYLGQFVVLFIFQWLRETEQIAACLSPYLWQVIARGHLGWGSDRGCGN